MEPHGKEESKFCEPPYSFHGPYVFYKSFTYHHDPLPRPDLDSARAEAPIVKSLFLGDYFFMRIPVKPNFPGHNHDDQRYLCLMAQLQLLWINRDRDAKLRTNPITNGGDVRLVISTTTPSSSDTTSACYEPLNGVEKVGGADVLLPGLNGHVTALESEDSCEIMLPSSLTPVEPAGSETGQGLPSKKPGRGRPRKADGCPAGSSESHQLLRAKLSNGSGVVNKAWLKVQNLPQTRANRFANIKVYFTPRHLVDWLANPRISYRYGMDEVVQLEMSVSLSFKEILDGIMNYNETFAGGKGVSPIVPRPINPYTCPWRADGVQESSSPVKILDRVCVLAYPAYLRYRAGLRKKQEEEEMSSAALDDNHLNHTLPSPDHLCPDIKEGGGADTEFKSNPCHEAKKCHVENGKIRFLFCKSTFPDESQSLTRTLFSTCTQAPIFRGRPKKDKVMLPKSRFRLSSLMTGSSHSSASHLKLLKGLTNSYKAKLGYGLVKKRYDAWKTFMRRPQGPSMENLFANGSSMLNDGLSLNYESELPTMVHRAPVPESAPANFGESDTRGEERPMPHTIASDESAREVFFNELRTFMSQRGTPIKKIPYLGFRPIDLYLFYKLVRTMGGYREVRFKRLWKRLYDHMGGCPNNTSAATCTRKHYENLLLPYEIYENRRQKYGAGLDRADSCDNAGDPNSDRQTEEMGSEGTAVHHILSSVKKWTQAENYARFQENGFGQSSQKRHDALDATTANSHNEDNGSESTIDRLFSLIMASKKEKSASSKSSPLAPLVPHNADGVDSVKRKRGRPKLTEEEKRLRSLRIPFMAQQRYYEMGMANSVAPLTGFDGGAGGMIIRKPKVFQSSEDRESENESGLNDDDFESPLRSLEQHLGFPTPMVNGEPYPPYQTSKGSSQPNFSPFTFPFPYPMSIPNTPGLDYSSNTSSPNQFESAITDSNDYSLSSYMPPRNSNNTFNPYDSTYPSPFGMLDGRKKKRGRPSTKFNYMADLFNHKFSTSKFASPMPTTHSPTPKDDNGVDESSTTTTVLTIASAETPDRLVTTPHAASSSNGGGGIGGSLKRKRGRPPKTAEEKAATQYANRKKLGENSYGGLPPFFRHPIDPSLLSFLPFLSQLPSELLRNSGAHSLSPWDMPLNFYPPPPHSDASSSAGHLSGHDVPPTPKSQSSSMRDFSENDLHPPTIAPDRGDHLRGPRSDQNRTCPNDSPKTAPADATTTAPEPTSPPPGTFNAPEPAAPNYSPVRQVRNPSFRRKGKAPLRITRNTDNGETITDSVPVITNGWAGTRPKEPEGGSPKPVGPNGGLGGHGKQQQPDFDDAFDEYRRVMEQHYRAYLNMSRVNDDQTPNERRESGTVE